MSKNKSLRMAMAGVIIGLMLNIVFSNSPNVLAIIPVAGALGGLTGYLIDKKMAMTKK